MKGLLRNAALHAFCLFVTTLILTGIKIQGGVVTYLIAGFVLTLVTAVSKPVRLIGIPLNMLSIGFFAVFVNMLILYVLTLLVPSVTIKPFIFQGYGMLGFIIPRMKLNTFFAFGFVAFVYTILDSFLTWLIRK